MINKANVNEIINDSNVVILTTSSLMEWMWQPHLFTDYLRLLYYILQ